MHYMPSQPARLKRSAASRLLVEPLGDDGAGGEFCERSPFAHLSGPLQGIARPSALSQIAQRVAAGAVLDRLVANLKNYKTARERHDEICSAYWRAVDAIELAHAQHDDTMLGYWRAVDTIQSSRGRLH